MREKGGKMSGKANENKWWKEAWKKKWKKRMKKRANPSGKKEEGREWKKGWKKRACWVEKSNDAGGKIGGNLRI